MSIDVLQAKIRKTKNPVMVCICPYWDHIPEFIRVEMLAEYGDTPQAVAQAYLKFSCGILDALSDFVPAVSVESGCFLVLGAEGIAVMQQVLRYAAEKGYYVLLDTMRADLPQTAENFAASCFGALQIGEQQYTPYPCDGVIMSGYLGSDAVKPFTQYCAEGKNVFLIARSSNKSAREVQDLLSGDRVVYQVMADLAMRWSTGLFGQNDYSEIGLVAGVTNADILNRLRSKYSQLFLLVPGFGAQGGNAKDAAYAFDRFGHGAAIMVGRSILYAYEKKGTDGTDYAECALEAAQKTRERILNYIMVM